MTPSEYIMRALRSEQSISSIARRAGIPKRSLQSVVEGATPSVDRAAVICAALGLELYVGPSRELPAWGPLAVSAGLPGLANERLGWVAGDFERYDQFERGDFLQRFRTAFTWLLGSEPPEALPPVPVPARTQSDFAEGSALAPDHRLVEISAVLGDAFDELNERGRQDLLVRFWAAFPDLRERASSGSGRRLAQP